MSQEGGIGTPGGLKHPVGDSLLSDRGQDGKTVTFPEVREEHSSLEKSQICQERRCWC